MNSNTTDQASPFRATAVPLLCFFVLTLCCCHAGGRTYQEQAEIMGTTFTITIDGFAEPRRAARAAFEEVRRIDRLLSTYKDDSEISDVNRRASTEPVAVGDDFQTVAEAARHYFELSEGSFDPTVLPLMRLWGFRKNQNRIPSQGEIDDTLRRAKPGRGDQRPERTAGPRERRPSVDKSETACIVAQPERRGARIKEMQRIVRVGSPLERSPE